MRIRRRNWILKRIVLGFAVAALVVPGTAMARVDEGGAGQPNSVAEVSKGSGYVPFVTDFPKYEVNVAQTPSAGVPHAGLNDYLLARDGIEVVRLNPRSNLRNSDMIEKVRVAPREVSTPQAVASPGFDWGDAGIGAGLAIGLALLAAAALRATRHLGRPQTA